MEYVAVECAGNQDIPGTWPSFRSQIVLRASLSWMSSRPKTNLGRLILCQIRVMDYIAGSSDSVEYDVE